MAYGSKYSAYEKLDKEEFDKIHPSDRAKKAFKHKPYYTGGDEVAATGEGSKTVQEFTKGIFGTGKENQ